MATIVNRRDVILQAAPVRVAGVTMAPNLAVDPSQVTGLGLIVSGAKAVDITADTQTFQVSTGGTPTPASMTLTVNLRNIAGTPSLSVLSGTLSVTPTLTGGPGTYTATLPYANMTSATATIRVSVTEAAVTYTDEISIAKVIDASSTVQAFLTNEAHTLPGDYLGNVLNYQGASGTFKLYQGSVDVTTSATFSVLSNPSSVTVSINATTGAYAVTGAYPTASTSITVTLRAVYAATNYDRVLTIKKQLTGFAGQRGSRTFYVTLPGVTATWSDALANSAAAVSGGPIINDVVTQSNSSQGFSQTKFWDGTVWQTVNAVVDGNLLVNGTVGATAIAANSIRATHILVDGGGASIWGDTAPVDISAWGASTIGWGTVLPTIVTLSDGSVGNSAFRCATNGAAAAAGIRRVPLQFGRRYRISCWARRSAAAANGVFYLRVNYGTTSTTTTVGDGHPSQTCWSAVTGGVEGVALTTTWTKYSWEFVPNTLAPYGAPSVLLNWTGTTGYHECQGLRIEEMIDSTLVVAGGITADRIDTRNLDIKDASGNVVFSSGSTYTRPNILPNGGFELGLTNWSVSMPGGGPNTFATQDNSWGRHVLSFTVANGTGVFNSAPVAAFAGGFYTVTGDSLIFAASGSCYFDMLFYDGAMALLLDSGQNAINATHDFSLTDSNRRTHAVQAQAPVGTAFVVVRFVWSGTTVTAVGLRQVKLEFGGLPATPYTPDSTAVETASNAYGAVRAGNPITSGNITTYISGASIGTAQINTLDASVITAGTITTDRIQVGAASVAATYTGTMVSAAFASTTVASATSLVLVPGGFTSTGSRVTVSGTLYVSVGNSVTLNESLLSTVAHVALEMQLRVDGVVKQSIVHVQPTSPVFATTSPAGGRHVIVALPMLHNEVLSAANHTITLNGYASFFTSAGAAVSSPGYFTIAASTLVQENKV